MIRVDADAPSRESAFSLGPSHAKFRSKAGDWAESNVAPYADAIALGHFPDEALSSAAAAGYMGIVVPEQYGGAGKDHLCFALFIEAVARHCASTAVALDVHASVGTEPIVRMGTEAQKQHYLPALARGTALGAFALTEPEAGSDASSLRTVARRDGDSYVLDGSKIFITNAGHAGLYIVLATTDRDAGARGISAFVVQADTPGLQVGKPQHKLGLLGSRTAEVNLRTCRVPLENRLGAEGSGFHIAMLALDSGRIGISAQAVGIADAALREVMALLSTYCKNVEIPQGMQFLLADLATQVEAARALTFEAARICDLGRPITMQASVAKLFATDAAMSCTTTALDLAANYCPYPALYRLERYFRDAKATQIYEGTNQIQRLVIARRVLEPQSS